MSNTPGQLLLDDQGRTVVGRPVRLSRAVLTEHERREKRLANLQKGWHGSKSSITQRNHVQLKEFLASILDDRRYRACLRRRMFSGEIAPGIEAMIYGYVMGKPPQSVDITATVGVTTLSLDRLSDTQLALVRDLLQGVAREQLALDGDDPIETPVDPTPETIP
jgi:hypothetical protein